MVIMIKKAMLRNRKRCVKRTGLFQVRCSGRTSSHRDLKIVTVSHAHLGGGAGGARILPGKNTCAKSEDGIELEAVKGEPRGQVGTLEEARGGGGGGGGVKVLEDRSCREHLGGQCGNSWWGDSGSDQDSKWNW